MNKKPATESKKPLQEVEEPVGVDFEQRVKELEARLLEKESLLKDKEDQTRKQKRDNPPQTQHIIFQDRDHLAKYVMAFPDSQIISHCKESLKHIFVYFDPCMGKSKAVKVKRHFPEYLEAFKEELSQAIASLEHPYSLDWRLESISNNFMLNKSSRRTIDKVLKENPDLRCFTFDLAYSNAVVGQNVNNCETIRRQIKVYRDDVVQ